MGDFVKGGVLLLFVSFLLALAQSCSMDKGIIQPPCFVYEPDLEGRWWYPTEDNPSQPAIYFHPNGLIETQGTADSVSFRIENCNKIRVKNLSSNIQEIWVIKNFTAGDLSIQFSGSGLINYSRKKI